MQDCRNNLRQSLSCQGWNRSAWIYYVASFVPVPLIDLVRTQKGLQRN